MKLAFSTLGCPAWTLEQIAAFAGINKVDGVELRCHADGNHFAPDSPLAKAREAKELFASKGTRIFACMGYTTFSSVNESELADNRDKLNYLLDLARELGASYVRTFVGQLKGATVEQVLTQGAEYLKECVAHAKQVGVRLGIETHDDWCDAANIKALQRAVHPDLGTIWDFANGTMGTGKTFEQQYEGLKGSILYCHVKDQNVIGPNKREFKLVGKGSQRIAEFVRFLRKEKLDLFLSFEHEKKWVPELPEPEVAFPQYLKFMREQLGKA